MDVPSSLARRSGDGEARARFEDLARKDDADIDVALGAALVARDVYPELDVTAVLRELDRLAAPLAPLRLGHATAEEQARALGEHLFGDGDRGGMGFRGNEADYYDPKNSLISDVLARRVGIPLTLAIVYCEIARRLGVPAHGVSFPGHFLVRVDRPEAGAAPLVIDPFFGGRALDDDELESRLTRAIGAGEAGRVASHKGAASSRAILVRMLTNLKAIYLTRNERARAHLAVDRIASLLPLAAGPLVERGLLALQLGARESARSDLTQALTLHPTTAEERMARAELAKLPAVRSSLN